jgi:hypothetical protein
VASITAARNAAREDRMAAMRITLNGTGVRAPSRTVAGRRPSLAI